MPKLVQVEGETVPEANGTVDKKASGAWRRSQPSMHHVSSGRKGNELGGLVFRDADAVAPADEQAKFLAELLKRYPDAGETKIDPSLQSLAVPVCSLEHDPDNAVTHPENNMRAIMESFAAFGQRKPIVVRAENMRVMAGNGSLEAVRRLGWEEIAASVQSMSDAEAAAYGLADNRTSDLHKWDKSKLMMLSTLIREANDPKVREVGWSRAELATIRSYIPPTVAPQLTDMQYKIVIQCESEEHQVQLIREFTERNIACQALIS